MGPRKGKNTGGKKVMRVELQQTKDWQMPRLSHPRCAGTKSPESLEAGASAAAPETAEGQLP